MDADAKDKEILVEIILVSGLFYFFYAVVDVVMDLAVAMAVATTAAYGSSSFYSAVAALEMDAETHTMMVAANSSLCSGVFV